MKILSRLLFLLMLLPTASSGEEHEQHSVGHAKLGVETLSPGLRALLSQEMRQLQIGMTQILPLYVSGKWAQIVPIASKIENSYVLKQKLTQEQVHELHSKLPDGFVELDQQFHYLSGMLAHAAKVEKPELVGFYFSKMNDTCVSCHTQHATHRFPALAAKKKAHGH